MVKFIYNNHVIVEGIHFFPELLTVKSLDGHEKMLAASGMVISHSQLTEVRIFHDLSEAGNTLFQDFLSVGYKKKLGISFTALIKIPIVKGRNSGLPRACCRHHQIIPAALTQSFCAEGIQHGLLVRIGLDIKGIGGVAPLFLPSPFPVDGTAQFIKVRHLKWLEFVGMPVGIKGGFHLGNDTGQVLFSDLHIPFHTIGNGGAGQIGGSYVSRRKSAVPIEHIGLRMKPCFLHVIGNPNLRIGQLRQHLHCLGICGTHVGGGHYPEMTAAGSKLAKAWQNEGEAGKADKGNQHIHAVTGHNFPVQLMNHGYIIPGIGKEEGIHQ